MGAAGTAPGDLARADGDVIVFLGRIDDQLNVGGSRLEPTEIEAELVALPGIRDAVVVAAGDILIAHVEADSLDEAAVRTTLAPKVPSTWIPRRFVLHDSLPRTSHGKVDRVAAAGLTVPDAASAAWEIPHEGTDSVLGLVVGFMAAGLRSIRHRTDHGLLRDRG